MDKWSHNKVVTDINETENEETASVKQQVRSRAGTDHGNGIINDVKPCQSNDVRIRTGSYLGECTNTTKEENGDTSSKTENYSLRRFLDAQHGTEKQRVEITTANEGYANEACLLDNFEDEEAHMRTSDGRYSCLTPTNITTPPTGKLSRSSCDITGKLSRSSCDIKHKRNTILFPASYKVQPETKSNMSRSLPSLIESSVQDTHIKDITSTPLYKEIYTNNIRQYSFLLAKKLGTSNQSPQELRKSYLENRQKAAARGMCATLQHKHMVPRPPDSSSRERLNEGDYESWSDTSSVESEPVLSDRRLSGTPGKHKGSLTDISRILCQCDHKSLTPELSKTIGSIQHSTSCNALAQVSNNLDDKNSEFQEKTCEHNVESVRLDQRQNEADTRRRARVARLNSFDDMVKHANNFLKDLKSKKKFSKSMEVF